LEKFIPQIAGIMFNIFAKNHIAHLNNKIHKARKRQTKGENTANARKIAKLQSDKGL